jgi:hypothetical protein
MDQAHLSLLDEYMSPICFCSFFLPKLFWQLKVVNRSTLGRPSIQQQIQPKLELRMQWNGLIRGARSNLSGTVASRMVSDGPVHWRAPLEYLVMQPVDLRGISTRRSYLSRPFSWDLCLQGPLLVPPKKRIYSCLLKKKWRTFFFLR